MSPKMARDQTVILRRDRVRGADALGLADRLPGRQSLTTRIALVTTAVAACAVLLTGLVSFGLIQGAAEREARDSLAADADLVSAAVGALEPGRLARNARLSRILRLFEQQGVTLVLIPADPADRVVPVLTATETDAVRAGQDVSGVREVDGQRLTGVDAYGKHLLLDAVSGDSVHVRLGMRGKWLRFAPVTGPDCRR